MALFPQFPYSNLHELNLDWLIEQISQLTGNGVVISVNGLSGVVTLYTDKNVVFPDRAFDPDWSVYRRIAEKHAGLQFTGEKFYYITKNVDDEDFTIQEVYTSGNLPPFPVTSVNGETGNVVIAIPVTSVNGRTGDIVLAGDNIPYNIDGSYTIEDIIVPLEKSIGHVIRYNTCSDGVTAGQYVYLIMSGISGRSDGLYKAVNAKSAGSVWTASDLSPVAGGLGALMAQNDSDIATLIGYFDNNTFIAPPMSSDYTLLSGGYIQKGKIVFVHMVVMSIGGAYTIATNLPQPKIAHLNSGRGAYLPNNLNKNITVNSNTALYIGESLPANTLFIITGTYICV